MQLQRLILSDTGILASIFLSACTEYILMSCADRNKRKYLTLAAVSMGGVWAKPHVDSVMLPAHATTTIVSDASLCEGSRWHFQVRFLLASCKSGVSCPGVPLGETVPIDPPRLQSHDFCLSEEELLAGEFNRDDDWGGPEFGAGPASDYTYIKYTVTQVTEVGMSGTVALNSKPCPVCACC